MKKNKNHLIGVFVKWLPMGLVVTILTFFTYATGQQILRMGANDPQIELSESVASSLASGQRPNVPGNKVDISKTLSLYVIVYNAKKEVVYSTAQLNGKDINVPTGVLDGAKSKGQNRLTWQPSRGVRQATVTTYFKGKQEGYVVVGRSLRETEKRIDQLTMFLTLTLAVALVGSFVVYYAIYLLKL